ncbi:universal stress protein [Dactylosporangium sp. NPDC005555]|uniref:universal stress protein n=1 Tax=Dactylosporangium sp. NPDC005555 TaxID=3154889 RepID=UPI0033B00C85
MRKREPSCTKRGSGVECAAIVVGVDGAEPSLAAVRWAAAEADRRRVPLRMVMACHRPAPLTAFTSEPARKVADDVLRVAAREATTAAPGVVVEATATPDRPAAALLRAGAGAGMLVVGTRGRHAATAVVLGSVSRQVATQATCPVTVVRGSVHPAGGVLVGVDSDPRAAQVVTAAFAEARQRGCPLLAVRVIETPPTPSAIGTPPLMYDVAEVRRSLTDEATRLVAAVGDRFPDVRWELHGVDGDAGRVLAHRSEDAQLVVVGSRGHGGLSGLLLGSVGLHLLHRAACPVLIHHEDTHVHLA